MGASGNLVCNADNKRRSLISDSVNSISYAKKTEKIKEEKNQRIEGKIRNYLKCNICYSKAKKPKMCKLCKKIFCDDCINKWLEIHLYCPMCKNHISHQDVIDIPILEDMTNFFINNIDNKSKSKNRVNNNKSENNKINEEDNFGICLSHNKKKEYCCIHCSEFFCSQCLIFFGENAKKHSNHLIIHVSKMNNLGMKEAVFEYIKLSKTKQKYDKLIEIIKLKLKENEIIKSQIKNYMNSLRDTQIKKIEENSNEIKSSLNNLENKKQNFDKLNLMLYNNMSNAKKIIQNVNNFDNLNLNEIYIRANISPKLFIENYESNFIEYILPNPTQYIEGKEILNYDINIIENYPGKLIMKYLFNKLFISFIIYINAPFNFINPFFRTYIIFEGQNNEFESFNLKRQNFNNNEAEIQYIEIDFQSFLSLISDKKKIKMKIHICKAFYK